MKIRKSAPVICIFLAIIFVLSSCNSASEYIAVSSDNVAMGSVVSVTSYVFSEESGRQLNNEIFSKIQELDQLISKNDENAALYKLTQFFFVKVFVFLVRNRRKVVGLGHYMFKRVPVHSFVRIVYRDRDYRGLCLKTAGKAA